MPKRSCLSRMMQQHVKPAANGSDSYSPIERLICKQTHQKNQALLHPKLSWLNEVHLSNNKDFLLKTLLLCANCPEPIYAAASRLVPEVTHLAINA